MTDELTSAHGGQLINREVSGDEAAALEQKAASLPALRLSSRALSDLELIGIGGLSPLDGFMTSDAYKSVVEKMRLPNGLEWSLPITLSAIRSISRNEPIFVKKILKRSSTERPPGSCCNAIHRGAVSNRPGG